MTGLSLLPSAHALIPLWALWVSNSSAFFCKLKEDKGFLGGGFRNSSGKMQNIAIIEDKKETKESGFPMQAPSIL
jgi:hypothetical protein